MSLSEEKKNIVFCGILTVSDSCSSGTKEDISGPNVQRIFDECSEIRAVVKVRKIVQDEFDAIKETLIDWCDKEKIDVIVTIGGTGFGLRDVTPEATSAVIEKEATGITIGLVAASLATTRFALLTRMKSGIRGKSLILNFPGSKKASEECLKFVLPVLNHAVDLIKNNIKKVAVTHGDSGRTLPPGELRTSSLSSVTNGSDQSVTPTQHHIVRPSHHGLTAASSGHHSAVDLMQTLSKTELDLECFDGDIDDISLTTFDSEFSSSLNKEKRKGDTGPDDFAGPDKVARRDRRSAYPLTPLDKALDIVLENAMTLPAQTISYENALRRTIAEPIEAPESIPKYSCSIKDGYAVIASDTPGELRVVGTAICGYPANEQILQKGQAVRITTGAPLPPGANAVVQVEDTELLEEADQGETEIRISVLKKVNINQDIRAAGSDIEKGEVVLSTGVIVGPSIIGVLASLGITKVSVFSQPTVAVLSTGNELTEPDSGPLQKGQIRDSNRIMLLSALNSSGYQTIDLGIVPDEPKQLKRSLENALARADVIITSGGVSMGEKDYLKSVLQNLGGKIEFGRVLLKPGKPTTFATFNSEGRKKLFFALPGNPVSAMVTFHIFALPALKKLSGVPNPNAPVMKARISSDIELDPRPEYQRCTVNWKPNDNSPWVTCTGKQASSRLTSMRNATALLVLPPKTPSCSELLRGDLVDVMILKSVM